LAKALGQAVLVDNKVGAAGNIAADFVAKATDNHTIGLMINGNMTIARLLNPKLPYDPLTDLTPISLIGVSPLVLCAPANAPGANADEFLAAARSGGNRWNYGTPGVGTVAIWAWSCSRPRPAQLPCMCPTLATPRSPPP
jgi:tripartite-type tricarboxylate transporter receptor subunit TctC